MEERPDRAAVVWDDELGEVDLVLDDRAGREGHAVLVEVYARYDVRTGELLSVDGVPSYPPQELPEA